MARTTRFTQLIAASFAVATLSTASFAVENTNWGALKQQLTNAPAAKRVVKAVTLSTDETAPTTLESRTVSAIIGPEGGSLDVADFNGPGNKDDFRAIFTVPAGALSEPVEITMVLHGEKLSEMVAEFFPAGLVFNTSAQLWLAAGSKLVDMSEAEILAWHIHGDSTEELATVSHIHTTASSTQVWIDVDGFSRYGLRSSAW